MRLQALASSVSPCPGSPASPILACWGGCLRGVLLVLLFCCVASAQSSKPLDGKPWDLGLCAGGGFSVPGGTKDTHTFDAGVRLGKVLTGDHGGGFVRGDFEWSADLMPVYYIWQPA